MDHGRVVNRILESKPEGRRRMVRPRFRWVAYVEKNLPKMKFKRW